MTGTPQQKHLEKIEDDQSIQGIERIDDTIRNDAGRKWFISQAIMPTVEQGVYVEHIGRILRGSTETRLTGTTYSAVSAANYTLTCPANTTYLIREAFLTNGTRAYSVSAVYTPLGGTATEFMDAGASTTTVASKQYVLGGSGNNTIQAGCMGPLRMWPGDTLQIVNENYQAADVTNYGFIYEVLTW